MTKKIQGLEEAIASWLGIANFVNTEIQETGDDKAKIPVYDQDIIFLCNILEAARAYAELQKDDMVARAKAAIEKRNKQEGCCDYVNEEIIDLIINSAMLGAVE